MKTKNLHKSLVMLLANRSCKGISNLKCFAVVRGKATITKPTLQHTFLETKGAPDQLSKDEYQFLQKSPVPSDFFQKSLPRLPIPTLEDTCGRYLASQRALCSSFQEFSGNVVRVKDFLVSNEGNELQKKLVALDKANQHTSYISAPWNDMYLKDRRAITFTHNPGVLLLNDSRPEFRQNPTLRAANLLISALR